MKRLAFALFAIPVAVDAAPFLISDSTLYVPAPTACGLYLDSAARQVVPIAIDAAGNPYCRFDLSAISTGPHTATATFIVDDPIWGSQEGAQSTPLVFAGPPAPPLPASLRLKATP